MHIVTAAVPGDVEFVREHPDTVHRLVLQRNAWLRPESLFLYMRLLWTSARHAGGGCVHGEELTG